MDTIWTESFVLDNQSPLSIVTCTHTVTMTLIMCIRSCWLNHKSLNVGYNATTNTCFGFNETITSHYVMLHDLQVFTSEYGLGQIYLLD